MFLSATHLPQALPRRAYADGAWYKREVDGIFLPTWILVTTLGDIPKHGDYATRTVLGREIIVHNHDGAPQAFLNVCPHRLAMLTTAPRGNMPTLKCQYHGWEFAPDGATRRIPDAPAFRPLERGQFGLVRLATELCGQLVFVRLSSDGPSLDDCLGAEGPLMREAFARHNTQICSWTRIVDANWKVVLENNLESYHVECVHQRSLGSMPDEKACQHELRDDASVFVAPGGIPGVVGWLHRSIAGGFGRQATRTYRHCLILPCLTWIALDDTCVAQTFEPLSVDRTLLTFRGFSVGTVQAAPLRKWILRTISANHMRFWERVWDEDVRLYPALQRGLASPLVPGTGLLSRREERIHHFQDWISRKLGQATSPDGRDTPGGGWLCGEASNCEKGSSNER